MAPNARQVATRLLGHVRRHFVGYVALVALAGVGTAQGVDGPVPGTNTIGSEDIIGNEVKSDDIGNGRIFNLDFADNIIQGGKITDETLTGADFADNSIIDPDISEATLFNDDSLVGSDINESTLFNDDSLTSADLFPDAVSADEVAGSAANTSKVEDESLDAEELAPDSVESAEIAIGQVSSSELGPIVIKRNTAEIAGNAFASVTVACPVGSQPMNVGFAADTGIRMAGTEAFANSFSAEFENTTGTLKNIDVAAVCLEA